MNRFALVLVLFLAPVPAAAQQTPAPPTATVDEGLSLLEQGARSLLHGLMTEMEPALDEMGRALEQVGPQIDSMGRAMEPMLRDVLGLMDSITNYQAPEILPNGDIIIRRKPEPLAPPGEGEVDL